MLQYTSTHMRPGSWCKQPSHQALSAPNGPQRYRLLAIQRTSPVAAGRDAPNEDAAADDDAYSRQRRRLFGGSSSGGRGRGGPRPVDDERAAPGSFRERGGRGEGGRGRGGRGRGLSRGTGRGRGWSDRYGNDEGAGQDNQEAGGSAADEVRQMISRQSKPPGGRGGMRGKGVKVLVDKEGGPKPSDSLRDARRKGAAIIKQLEEERRRAERGRPQRSADGDAGDDWDRDEGTEGAEGAERGRRRTQGKSSSSTRVGDEKRPPKVDPNQERARTAREARQAELAARDPRFTGGVQLNQEERAAMAAGMKRSFARAEALAEGEWERLKKQYLQIDVTFKIGRRGATEELADAIKQGWRKSEVVKVRVHDDKSARKSVLPRLNLVLRELEEKSGGVLIDVRGTSIWLYRGADFVLPPKILPKVIEPTVLMKPGGSPQGAWRVIEGIRCYEAGSPATGPPVVVLPDAFKLEEHTPATMQVCDRISATGLWVVMPDLLPPSDTWPMERWPPESVWKNRFADWLRVGPGNWKQQQDKVAALMTAIREEVKQHQQQQQGEGSGSSSSGSDTDEVPKVGVAGIGWGALMAVWAGTKGAFTPGVAASAPKGDASTPEDAASAPKDASSPPKGAASTPLPAVVAALTPQFHGQDEKLAALLSVPLIILPSKYDSMDKLQVFVSARKQIYRRCEFKRFGHCKPGLLSYAPVFTDYDINDNKNKEGRTKLKAVAQASEMVDTAAEFLKRHLLGLPGSEDVGEGEGASEGQGVEREGEEGSDGGEQQQEEVGRKRKAAAPAAETAAA